MARIEGYAYSDGTSRFRAVNSLVVEEAPSSPATTTCRLAAPTVFTDALAAWQTLLFTLTPAGVYVVSYSATTRRVTIATTNGVKFKPVWTADPDLARWLGFNPSAVYGFALSHTGTAVPLGRADVAGIAVEAPEDAAQVDTQALRLGRVVVPVYGNHLLQRVELLATRAQRPSAWHWLTTGRVRVYPTADTSPYSVANLDGYVDGYVVDQPVFEDLGDDEGQTLITITLALSRG